jgi:malate dehydrogenase (oxaloacetate-decarboxylating)
MKLAAAFAIADCVSNPSREQIIPDSLNQEISIKVANAVKNVCYE